MRTIKYLISCNYLVIVALLFGEVPQTRGRHIGAIDSICDPTMVVRDAYENARFLCDQYYLASPELEIVEHNRKVEDGRLSIELDNFKI